MAVPRLQFPVGARELGETVRTYGTNQLGATDQPRSYRYAPSTAARRPNPERSAN